MKYHERVPKLRKRTAANLLLPNLPKFLKSRVNPSTQIYYTNLLLYLFYQQKGGEIEISKYKSNYKDRYWALQRALKMVMLFQETNFDNSVGVLNKAPGTPGRDEASFKAACPASLTVEEKEWRWNYLEKCFDTSSTGTEKGNWKKANVKDVTANSGWYSIKGFI